MSTVPELRIERKIPTRKDALVFRGKTFLLQVRRSLEDTLDARIKRFPYSDTLTGKSTVAESKTPLWTEAEPEERFLVAGKIQNLRVAARRLDGIEIPGGELFSFWKQMGRASRFRGFVPGRELREGCIIPNIGGGLCQLSNALYDAALQANFEIVERHPHTQVVPGSIAEQGRDATVFWNYIDLRFRSAKPFRIEVKLDPEFLTVRFKGEKTETQRFHQITRAAVSDETPNSCATCEVGDCHKALAPAENLSFGKTAFLLDEFSPEFDEYIRQRRTADDHLFVPLDGKRYKKANYAWTTAGFGALSQSLLVTAVRSYRSRKLSVQGRERQRNLLSMYERLANSYARSMRFDVLHLVVQQDLLPFLWKGGHLGGRTFDVLMTALPMSELQEKLDLAHSLHPQSKTLGDFRAEKWLVEAETQALKAARRIVTPHTGIASLFPKRAEVLEWKIPSAATVRGPKNAKPTIVFPASTVGRKGCYEIREAVGAFDVKVVTLGGDIEGSDFWNGFDRERAENEWLKTADIVVLPAFVEHRPRRLLMAAAAGIPVIASTACGVGNVSGIKSIESGDVDGLREAIKETLVKGGFI